MSQHVIVGAGPVGTATALLLAERGEKVRLVTRRGTGPEHPSIERVAADATDARPPERAGRGRRRALQLREPAVPHLAHRLAAARLRPCSPRPSAAEQRSSPPRRCTGTARSTAR